MHVYARSDLACCCIPILKLIKGGVVGEGRGKACVYTMCAIKEVSVMNDISNYQLLLKSTTP